MILKIDFNSETPIYMQIRNQVVIGISNGELREGDHLPTVRALSDESGVNAMTISKAYQLLKKEGFISSDRRSGAVIRCCDDISVSPELISRFKLCISELKASGMGEESIIDLCRKLYEE